MNTVVEPHLDLRLPHLGILSILWNGIVFFAQTLLELKDALHLVFGDAWSFIVHRHSQHRSFCVILYLDLNALVARELHSVGGQVGENLLQALLVTTADLRH
jgi:hypothetical protein